MANDYLYMFISGLKNKLQYTVHECFSEWERCCSKIEALFSSCRDQAQYKYLARPIYKFTATYLHPTAAVGVTFLAMDLLVHQMAPQMAICALANLEEYPRACHLTWRPILTFIWSAFAIPVMYAKYKKN